MLYLMLFVAGVVGGFVAGVTGIGTGILMLAIIPLVLQSLGCPESAIIPMTIANTVVGTLFASLMNNLTVIKNKRFYKKEAIIVGVSGASFALVVLEGFVKGTTYSPVLYNFLIVSVMFFIIYRTLKRSTSAASVKESATPLKLVLSGFSGGLIAALSGLGGGSLTIPSLHLWCKMDMKKAKSVTYSMIFLTAIVLTTSNFLSEPLFEYQLTYGLIVLPIVLPLVCGVMLAAPFGVGLGERLSSKSIAILFSVFVGVVTIKKLYDLIVSIG